MLVNKLQLTKILNLTGLDVETMNIFASAIFSSGLTEFYPATNC